MLAWLARRVALPIDHRRRHHARAALTTMCSLRPGCLSGFLRELREDFSTPGEERLLRGAWGQSAGFL